MGQIIVNNKSILNKKHIILFSGGMASFEVCRRVLSSFDKNDIIILFFDTKIEDEDTYRFIDDCENFFRFPIERLEDGRNMWQVFRDERFIGNSQKCVCTRVLKRELLIKFLHKKYSQSEVILYFGLEPFEQKRIKKVEDGWEKRNIEVSFLLLFEPKGNSKLYKETILSNGLEPPRFYGYGFTHNNCGGACVRAGIAQWIHLYNLFPERYLWHEMQEEITREYLNKDISILKDRRGKITKPLTLRNLREQIDRRR